MRNLAVPDFNSFKLGETSEQIDVETAEEVRLAAIGLVTQARRNLDIMTRDLEHTVYDNAEFADALKHLVLDSPRARVRVLVKDTAAIVQRGHRVLDLARRLSSFVQIRVPAREHIHFNDAFLVADEVGIIHRRLSDRYDGQVNFNAALEARNLTSVFNEQWEIATPDPNVRRLSI